MCRHLSSPAAHHPGRHAIGRHDCNRFHRRCSVPVFHFCSWAAAVTQLQTRVRIAIGRICLTACLVETCVHILSTRAPHNISPPFVVVVVVVIVVCFVLFYFVCVCVCACVRVFSQHARGPPQPLPQSRCRVREYTRTRYSPRMVSLSDCSVSIACAQISPSLRDNWLAGWRSLRRDSMRVI